MHAGKILKIIRVAEGISQASLAERAAVSQGFLAQIENGHRIPSSPLLEGLCKELGVPVWQLYFLVAVEEVQVGEDELRAIIEVFPYLSVYLDDMRCGKTKLSRSPLIAPYRQLSLFTGA